MMPYLKQIAAHSDCQAIENYLEKNGRALAKDFFNLSIDERDGFGDGGKDDIRWADEMDDTRHRFGNDRAFGDMRARTYKHFIVSPDPKDNIDLAGLRELTCAWALKHFDDFQIAIVYHDDNEKGIPHAHVIVNNTNLVTGLRMHHDDPKAFNRDLQQMAEERQLRHLSNRQEAKEGLERLARKEHQQVQRPKTMQQLHLGRVEQELVEAGNYSWVADIRNRVSVAKSLARNEGEFKQVLGILGVNVADNSRKAKRDDWVFSFADTPTQKVSGERLGLLFAKETIRRELKRANSYHPDAKSSQALLRNARNAVLINDLQELDRLSQALTICAQNNVSSIQECDRKLEAMHRRIDSSAGDLKAALVKSAEELEGAKAYMVSNGLLPKRLAAPEQREGKRLYRPTSPRGAYADEQQAPSNQLEKHEKQHDGRKIR